MNVLSADQQPLVRSKSLKVRIVFIYVVLAVLNLAGWLLTLLVSTQFAPILGTGLVAYTFGLRHGVDADHIAAIDNVTRKLMQEGKRPVGVGFFFALGHSTIVIVLCAVVAVSASVLQNEVPALQDVGSWLGTGLSATFLYLIGIINLLVLIDIYRSFRKAVKGEILHEDALTNMLNRRGILNRIFGPIIRSVNSSWKMYFVGILFGLGFETASEVTLLGFASTNATNGMPVLYVLVLPLLFAAGMSLVDTTDSILMVGAYGWAFVKPVRKLYYNFTITLVSVLVALIIGTIEALGIIADKFNLSGGFWDLVNQLDLNILGFIIIGVFLASWGISSLVYKLKKYDQLEVETMQ
jgi:high-affinity nickel-transport protein